MDLHPLIGRFGLAPHPEGGWYRELHRSASSGAGRQRRQAGPNITAFATPEQQFSSLAAKPERLSCGPTCAGSSDNPDQALERTPQTARLLLRESATSAGRHA